MASAELRRGRADYGYPLALRGSNFGQFSSGFRAGKSFGRSGKRNPVPCSQRPSNLSQNCIASSCHANSYTHRFVDIDFDTPDINKACFGPVQLAEIASEGPASDCVVEDRCSKPKIDAFKGELADPDLLRKECILALKFLLRFVGNSISLCMRHVVSTPTPRRTMLAETASASFTAMQPCRCVCTFLR